MGHVKAVHGAWRWIPRPDECGVDPDFDDFDETWAHSVATVGTISLDPMAWNDCEDVFIPAGRRAAPEPKIEKASPERRKRTKSALKLVPPLRSQGVASRDWAAESRQAHDLQRAAEEDARNMRALEERMARIRQQQGDKNG